MRRCSRMGVSGTSYGRHVPAGSCHELKFQRWFNVVVVHIAAGAWGWVSIESALIQRWRWISVDSMLVRFFWYVPMRILVEICFLYILYIVYYWLFYFHFACIFFFPFLLPLHLRTKIKYLSLYHANMSKKLFPFVNMTDIKLINTRHDLIERSLPYWCAHWPMMHLRSAFANRRFFPFPTFLSVNPDI